MPDTHDARDHKKTLSTAAPRAGLRHEQLSPTIEFLIKHSPFDRMAPKHLEFLARRLTLGFHPKDAVIATPDAGEAQRLFIIKQGRVRGESVPGGPADYGVWELTAGECFPIGALLSRRPVHTLHRAVEDTFCFELERADFAHLLAESMVFKDFCSGRLTNLLEQALRELRARTAAQTAEAASLNVPVGSLLRRPPVSCAPGTPVRAALATMHRERVGSIVVIDAAGRPLGIFTLHDLLGRTALAPGGLEGAIDRFMTPMPQGLPPHAPAYEAALLMVQHGFGHLCIVEQERLVGVLSERDLFALQRAGLVPLTRGILRAASIADLNRSAQDIHRLIDQMLAQGASVEQINRILTLLNDKVTGRVIELCLAQTDAGDLPFTWLAFGSEGRREQTRKTDQDNGILFQAPAGIPLDIARTRLLSLAQHVNDALAACGLPLCPGGIMARNPEYCLSGEEWRARFGEWIERGGPQELLKASIFFDMRALYGDAAPVQALRAEVLAQAAANRRFLRQLAETVLTYRPPLGFVRDFFLPSTEPFILDLKLQGAAIFVDAARLLALSGAVPEVNTLDRLRAAAAAGALPAGEAEAGCAAYSFLQLLRMRLHQQQARAGQPLDNRLNLNTLNDLEQRVLKESLRQARKLQSRLRLDYQL